MKGISKWLNKNVNFITEVVQEVVSVARNVMYGASVVASSPIVKQGTKEVLQQSKFSLTYLFNPQAVKAIWQSKRTRYYLGSAFVVNSTLIVSVVLNEAFIKPVNREWEEAGETSITNELINYVAWFLLTRITFHALVDRTANLWSISKVISVEHPNNEQSCRCIKFNKVKSELDSPINYLGAIGQTYLLGLMLGRLAFPFRALIEGESLLSYKLASAGICARHQRQIVNANNVGCFLVGSIFLFIVNTVTKRINSYFNIEGDGLYWPIYHTLLPIFLILALTNKSRMLHQTGGLDVFKYGRLVLKMMIKDIFFYINQHLSGPKKEENLSLVVKGLSNSKLIEMIKKVLLDETFHNLNNIVVQTSINNAINLYATDITEAVKGIRSVRCIPFTNALPTLADILPNYLSDITKVLLKVVFNNNNNLDQALKKAEALIARAKKHAENKQKMHFAIKDKKKDFCRLSTTAKLSAGWINCASPEKDDLVAFESADKLTSVSEIGNYKGERKTDAEIEASLMDVYLHAEQQLVKVDRVKMSNHRFRLFTEIEPDVLEMLDPALEEKEEERPLSSSPLSEIESGFEEAYPGCSSNEARPG